MGGALFFNANYYQHGKQSAYYWYITFCHELAHNTAKALIPHHPEFDHPDTNWRPTTRNTKLPRRPC